MYKICKHCGMFVTGVSSYLSLNLCIKGGTIAMAQLPERSFPKPEVPDANPGNSNVIKSFPALTVSCWRAKNNVQRLRISVGPDG